MSQAIASNSTAALAFDNADDASVVLVRLQGRPAHRRGGAVRCARQGIRNVPESLGRGALSGPARRGGATPSGAPS